MKRFSILRSQAALLMMARFFAETAVRTARAGDAENERQLDLRGYGVQNW